MKQLTAFLLPVLLLLTFTSQAQQITGRMFDSSNMKPVSNAVIMLLTPKDSLLHSFTRTAKDGTFSLGPVTAGSFIFSATHPYFADYLDDVNVGAGGLQLNTIGFLSKSKVLQEVIIRSGGAMKIKGDTVSYTADSFKVSANANVEELLKKLPGIQVDKNGEIKAMGEKVEKVLVDGEEFFGNDPGIAVKNLRADAVKEVQVFDKKSEQAEFTGIDDGQKQKTINLKLKEDKKKGYFGKADVAGGPLKTIEDRYNSNFMVNAFRGKRKMAAFLLRGNTGQDGLGWQDNEKYGGQSDDMSMGMDEESGGMWIMRTGGTDDEPYVDTENGFITNTNAGLHYSNKWNDKHTLNLSPKYNDQQFTNRVQNFTQQQVGDSIMNERAVTNRDIYRRNFKNNLSYDVKIDSLNSLKVTLKANFYHTESTENRDAETRSNTNTLKNSIDRTYSQVIDKTALSASVLYRHKFKKARRTFSLNGEWHRLSSESNNLLISDNQSYVNGLPSFNILQNQQINYDKSTDKLTAKAVYTEPLNKKFSLELSHEFSYSSGKNDQMTNSYSTTTGKYDQFVDSLSNDFLQTIYLNKPAVKISYNHKKFRFNFGSGFGITNFNFNDRTMNKLYERDFTNIFPSAGLVFTYKPNHSVTFNYNGNTKQPTLNQLQPLRNNNDYFNQYIGNPTLKQSFTNNFSIWHNSYNFLKELWTYQSFNLTTTTNAITNSITVSLDSGKTITQPINTNGNISMNFWGGIGTKIKKLKMNVNISPNFNYSKFADVINGRTSYSRTFSGGLNLWMNKQKDKKYDVGLSNDFNYNRNTTSQNNLVNSYFINTLSLNATVYLKKVWSLQSDVNFVARQKTVQFQDNLTNYIWNARFQRTFHNNEFTAYVMVRDILNQNIGISRNYNGNYTREEINNRLKRYFMIGFTWDFKNNGGAKK